MTNIDNNTISNNVIAGPQSETAVSKQKNALVHGIYASDNVLSWESAEEFETLHAELKAEWGPEGRTEEETVLALARLHWLKHRLVRSTQLAFQRDPFVAGLEKSGVKDWVDVANCLKKEAETEDGIMDTVKETMDELKVATKAASSIMTASSPDTVEIYNKVETVEFMFQKMLPVYQQVYDKGYGPKTRNENGNDLYIDVKTTVEKAYHPDYLEKIIRLEASIDTRIDKTLSRLVNTKTCKRLLKEESAKQISSQ